MSLCETHHESEEDILSSSLQTLYDYTPIAHSSPGSPFTYTISTPDRAKTVIELQTPDPQASNWNLHASSIWVASLFLADHIDDLGLHRLHDRARVRVLELGAGAGLPSILIARTHQNASVTASDYPDAGLMGTLSENIERNGVACRARAVPYDWGSDISPLVGEGEGRGAPAARGPLFDVVVAADTLWNPALHSQFIKSLAMCLERSPDSRVHLVAGLHTGRYTIQAFLGSQTMQDLGLIVDSVLERQVAGTLSRPWNVSLAENEDEQERRRWIVWIVIRWGEYRKL